MNYPSTMGTNWKWRADAAAFTEKLQKEIRSLTEFAFRAEPLPEKAAAESGKTKENKSTKETENTEQTKRCKIQRRA